MDFFDELKKFKSCIIKLVAIVILIPIMLSIPYIIGANGFVLIYTSIQIGDLWGLYGAFLTFTGTITLGVFTFIQNKQLTNRNLVMEQRSDVFVTNVSVFKQPKHFKYMSAQAMHDGIVMHHSKYSGRMEDYSFCAIKLELALTSKLSIPSQMEVLDQDCIVSYIDSTSNSLVRFVVDRFGDSSGQDATKVFTYRADPFNLVSVNSKLDMFYLRLYLVFNSTYTPDGSDITPRSNDAMYQSFLTGCFNLALPLRAINDFNVVEDCTLNILVNAEIDKETDDRIIYKADCSKQTRSCYIMSKTKQQ